MYKMRPMRGKNIVSRIHPAEEMPLFPASENIQPQKTTRIPMGMDINRMPKMTSAGSASWALALEAPMAVNSARMMAATRTARGIIA